MMKANMNEAFDRAREIAKECKTGAWVATHTFQECFYGPNSEEPPYPAQGGEYSIWEFEHGADRPWQWSRGLKKEVFMQRGPNGFWEKTEV